MPHSEIQCEFQITGAINHKRSTGESTYDWFSFTIACISDIAIIILLLRKCKDAILRAVGDIKSIILLSAVKKTFYCNFFFNFIFLLLGNTCETFESMKVEFMYSYMPYVRCFSIYIDSYIILSQILSRLLNLCWSLGPIKKE